eukprot:297846-Chlamydomonas_euryale.AAC.3
MLHSAGTKPIKHPSKAHHPNSAFAIRLANCSCCSNKRPSKQACMYSMHVSELSDHAHGPACREGLRVEAEEQAQGAGGRQIGSRLQWQSARECGERSPAVMARSLMMPPQT